MKLNAIIKDQRIETLISMPDGVYELNIREKGDAKTYEQVKKLWATIDDISRSEYGDISQSSNIYLQILDMAGVRTDKLLIPKEAIKDLKKKVRALSVVSEEMINHIPYSLVNVCLSGISDMSKKEVANVIECAIKWASELGIDTELERISND